MYLVFLPHVPDLFMTSQTQTAGHRMAGATHDFRTSILTNGTEIEWKIAGCLFCFLANSWSEHHVTVLTGGAGTIDFSRGHSSNERPFPNLIAPDISLVIRKRTQSYLFGRFCSESVAMDWLVRKNVAASHEILSVTFRLAKMLGRLTARNSLIL